MCRNDSPSWVVTCSIQSHKEAIPVPVLLSHRPKSQSPKIPLLMSCRPSPSCCRPILSRVMSAIRVGSTPDGGQNNRSGPAAGGRWTQSSSFSDIVACASRPALVLDCG